MTKKVYIGECYSSQWQKKNCYKISAMRKSDMIMLLIGLFKRTVVDAVVPFQIVNYSVDHDDEEDVKYEPILPDINVFEIGGLWQT